MVKPILCSSTIFAILGSVGAFTHKNALFFIPAAGTKHPSYRSYGTFAQLSKPSPTFRNNGGVGALQAIKGPVRYTSGDWIECLVSLPSSRILKRTRLNILVNALWTTLLVCMFKIFKWKFSLPSIIHSILGSALGLLLVFRTNSSYDRFWEGRKLWSSIITQARDISRLAYIHTDKDWHEKIAKLIILFCITLKQHLQGERVNSEVACFIEDKDEVESLQSLRNRPAFILRNLGETVHRALLEKYSGQEAILHEHAFNEHLHGLSTAETGCERLVKQPVPLAYSRHTSRFLTLYLYTLPFALLPSLGWMTIPTLIAVSWSFLSIQEIGQFIEEPFNKDLEILPLSQLISVIRSDVSELMDGVVSSPDIVKFDQKMLASAKDRARMKDDSWFAYY